MQGLAEALPGVQLATTQALGLPVHQVEATAFAWLARQFVKRQANVCRPLPVPPALACWAPSTPPDRPDGRPPPRDSGPVPGPLQPSPAPRFGPL